MTKASQTRRTKRAAKKNGASNGTTSKTQVESIALHESEKKQLATQKKKMLEAQAAIAHWTEQKAIVDARINAATQAYSKEKQALQAAADALAEAHGIDTSANAGWRVDLEAYELRKQPPQQQQQQPALAPPPPAPSAPDASAAEA